MNYKKKVYFLGLCSVVFNLLLNISCYSFVRDLCMDNEGLFIFISLFFGATFLISVIFLFLGTNAFMQWKKMSLIFFPVAVILVYILPDMLSGGIISIDGELVAKWLSGIFFIISIIIILVKRKKHGILEGTR